MSRFRIKVEVLRNGGTIYRAQWSPFLFCWLNVQRYNFSDITFNSEEDAKDWLERMRGLDVVKTYIKN